MILCLLLVFISQTGRAESTIKVSGIWYKMPPGSYHLRPAIFFSPQLLKKIKSTININEADAVFIQHGNQQIEFRIYSSFRSGDTFAVDKTWGKKLGLHTGRNRLIIKKNLESSLPPRPLTPHHYPHPGNIQRWPQMLIGAPHGDCDWFTGHIVELINQKAQIPALVSYGCRFPYKGVWFDCNRPLMKNAAHDRSSGKNGIGVVSQRSWNTKSIKVYQHYQNLLQMLSQSSERINLLTSLHGHDLTIKLSNGRVVSKNVIEGIGTGFTHQELRRIKEFYKDNITKYFNSPPPLYFGNLPEDQSFYIHGKKSYFVYSAVGTRISGSLRLDKIKHGLHFETPNSIRTTPQAQEKLAQFLIELYTFIRDDILNERTPFPKRRSHNQIRTERVDIPASTFTMGSKKRNSWDNERPQHRVYLSNYQIDKYEVTNKQFIIFLNKALKDNKLQVKDGIVYDKNNSPHIIIKLHNAAPLSPVKFTNGKFLIDQELENYPVIHVSYYGASKYASWAGGKLPTEAQWEKAASWNPRLHKKYTYAIDSSDLNQMNVEDVQNQTFTGLTPVGFFDATSYYGVADMSGNVWEWTADNYADDTYRHRTGTVRNPRGPHKGTMKTIRGGSWNFERQVARTTMRIGVHPNFTAANIGFRCIY